MKKAHIWSCVLAFNLFPIGAAKNKLLCFLKELFEAKFGLLFAEGNISRKSGQYSVK